MTLEDQLRDVLADDRRALPAWPDAADRVRSGMRRRTRRRAAAGAVSAAVLVVMALPVALLNHTGGPAVVGPGTVVHPVPWPRDPRPYPATTGPAPTATDAHVCTVADFVDHAAVTGAGTPRVVITLADRGSTPCQLLDVPKLVTVDAVRAAHVVPVNLTENPNLLPPPVAPGESVQLVVETCAGTHPLVYDQLALAIGDSGRIPVPGLTLTSTCTVRIGAWHRNG